MKISTAESVTGGKIISTLIEVPGASNITEQSYVVYSNEAKHQVLGVDNDIIDAFGVVSEEVAIEMARKLKSMTKADIIVTTTGEAGPIPSESGIVVGTVCFGLIIDDREYVNRKIFAGDRIGIMENAVAYILNDLLYKLS